MKCEKCQGESFIKNGPRPKKDGVYQRYSCKNCGEPLSVKISDASPPAPRIEDDLRERKHRQEQTAHKQDRERLLAEVESLQRELEAVKHIKDIDTYEMPIQPETTDSHSTAFTIWSDWHIEERVEKNTVNGLNEFNLDIAKKRVEYLANRVVKFLRMYRKDTKIENMVIFLGGDFITGNIHEENLENCLLRPIDAIMYAEELVASAIEFIKAHTEINIKVVCVVGNHPRITAKVHYATEHGNSLEYYMYHHLAKYFKKHGGAEFFIAGSSHFYLDIYGLKIRCAHGHQVRYAGGVGGLLIPLRRKVMEWDKAIKADMNIMCHFHQEQKFGRILVNGSLIGFNKYALDRGYEYEDPRQSFFLLNGNRKKLSIYSPVLL